jgi:fused signal recognition particle receptor
MTIAIILIALAVVVGGTAVFITVTRRRGGRPELEPPPAAPADARPATSRAEPQLAPEQVAEIEAALQEAEPEAAPEVVEEPPPAPPGEPPPAPVKPRFRDRLGQARSLFGGYVRSVRSRGKVSEETWEDLEEALIRADVGVELTTELLDDLRSRVKAESISEPDAVLDALRAELVERLAGDRELRFAGAGPDIWLFVGVNGVGKTTTIGKIGMRAIDDGRSVVMAAADTFRAAAADQLDLWARRVGADFVRGAEGGDPGAVVFDAKERAAARHSDLVLADTAGRLHTKVNLMEELKKVRRVAERPPGQLSEVLLVIDATTGQNGLVQAKEFAAAVGVTGVVLTKLDGTAKGGIALAIQAELGIPIKLVGLGEAPEDLVDFDASEFVDALLT